MVKYVLLNGSAWDEITSHAITWLLTDEDGRCFDSAYTYLSIFNERNGYQYEHGLCI
jgi:hypothetical protein